jgi:hypothetical protein
MPRYVNVAAGSNDRPNGNYIPVIWSLKCQKRFYARTVLSDITNSDWEGEIKGKGSKVEIRVPPVIAIFDYEKDGDVDFQDIEDDKIELFIDQAKGYAFKIDDIDKYQEDIDSMNKGTIDAAMNLKIAIETKVFSTIYANVASGNDLGAFVLTKANILEFIVSCETRLLEQNVPIEDGGGWMLLPPWACALIKNSELKDASISGDGVSLLRDRKGYLGYISCLKIYCSNLINNDGTDWDVMAGTKDFTCFASQFVKTRTGQIEKGYADYIKGLNVFGYKETKPEAGVTASISKS